MPAAALRGDFYISYHPADKAWAEWLGDTLEHHGYDVFVQDWVLKPGENIIARKSEALDRCRYTVAVITRAYLASPACRDDWTSAFLRVAEERARLLCVRVEDCDLPSHMAVRGVIDLVDRDEDSAERHLLNRLKPSQRHQGERPDYPAPQPQPQPQPQRARSAVPHRYPAILPEIFRVPPRNDQFTGRIEELEWLRRELGNGPAVLHTAALHGLGGVGKSQLAIEYAHRFATSYNLIWWIAAEAKAVMQEDLDALAAELRIPLASDERRRTEALRQELRRRSRWLVIYDNAENPKDLYPLPEGGHVLITSRNPDWSGIATGRALNVLSASEAAAFLDKRLNRGAGAEAQREEFGELAERLGHLPLALEQAAAYIESASVGISDYLGLLAGSAYAAFPDKPPVGYSDTVLTTWQISLRRIRRHFPDAYALLLFCSYLAPDAIPRRLLAASADRLPPPLRAVAGDTSRFNQAVVDLKQYSLIKATPDELSLHRLVQWAVRRFAARRRAALVRQTVHWLAQIYPGKPDQPGYASSAGALIPHVLAVRSNAQIALSRRTAVELADLLRNAAVYLHTQARIPAAADLFRAAIGILGNTRSTDGQMLRTRHAYGRLLQDMGKSRTALEEFDHVLGRLAPGSQLESELLVPVLADKGRLLQEEGDLREARSCIERAIVLIPELLPKETPVTVSLRVKAHGHHGRILQDLGDIPGALVSYERALELALQAFGEQDTRVALRRNNLAGALYLAGELSSARTQLEAALTTLQQQYAPDHDRTIAVRINLGATLHALGDYDNCRGQLEHALSICERLKLPGDPRRPMIESGLGVLAHELGELSSALDHHRAALESARELYSTDHPRMVVVASNAGCAMARAGDSQSAALILESAMAAACGLYGERHPRTAAVRSHWGMCLAAAGDLGTAWQEELLAYEDSLSVYGKSHNRTATIENNLGCIRHHQGRPEDAHRHFMRAFEAACRSYGPAHPRTVVIRANSELDPHGNRSARPLPLFIALHIHQHATVIDL